MQNISKSVAVQNLYSPWNFPGQNNGVGSLSLLQEIYLTQGLNTDLAHCRWILYQLSHKGSPPFRQMANKQKQWQVLLSLVPKSPWMVTAAMK